MANTVPNDWKAAAVAITPGFEVQGDPYLGVSGDFDGMGISCGALQWNIGSKSLQPMVQKVGKAVVLSNMPSFGDEMWDACSGAVNEWPRHCEKMANWRQAESPAESGATSFDGLSGDARPAG